MKFIWMLLGLGLLGCGRQQEQLAPGARPTVRIRWSHDPESLDPLALPNQYAVEACNLLQGSLLQVNYATRSLAPALADSLPAVQLLGDSLTRLRYHLRPATWDDGQPVTAADVALTLKLLYCPGLPNENARANYDFITAVQPDPHDPRRFNLLCRGQGGDYALASGDFPVLSESILDPHHVLRAYSLAALRQPAAAPLAALVAVAQRYHQLDAAHHPERLPGCGPYQLASWQAGHSLRFVRKANWWGRRVQPTPLVLQAQAPALDYLILPSDAAATLALRRHELDVYAQVPARDFARLQASADAAQALVFYTGPGYDVVTAGFNTRQPALHDKLTRQALSCLFDPAGLLAGTQLGQGERTVGLLPPTSPDYATHLPLPRLNPARATALLQQAGWQRQADGWHRAPAQYLSLTLRYRADEALFETVALQFRAAAGQLGIAVALQPTESTAMSERLRAGDFDVYVRKLKGNPFLVNFMPVLHSRAVGAGNLTGFGTPASDRLLEQLAAAPSPAERHRLLARFQAMLLDEAPLVPLFVLPYRLAANRQLRGLLPSGLKPGYSAITLSWAGRADTLAPQR